MASLRIHPSVHPGTFDQIGTIQRRLTRNYVMQRKALSVSASRTLLNPQQDRVIKNDRRKGDVLSENLDHWMKESMVDIVKNLNQAPLLVHIYAENDQERRPQIKTEKAIVEKWHMMRNEWESEKTRSPDGLIFIEEIKDEEEDRKINEDPEEGLTKSWGVVVQEKGVDYGPACYLLKTSRVRAGRGMGLFATHFCLVKVQNFRKSALKQFKSCWL